MTRSIRDCKIVGRITLTSIESPDVSISDGHESICGYSPKQVIVSFHNKLNCKFRVQTFDSKFLERQHGPVVLKIWVAIQMRS